MRKRRIIKKLIGSRGWVAIVPIVLPIGQRLRLEKIRRLTISCSGVGGPPGGRFDVFSRRAFEPIDVARKYALGRMRCAPLAHFFICPLLPQSPDGPRGVVAASRVSRKFFGCPGSAFANARWRARLSQ
jgi:hypothetical protein